MEHVLLSDLYSDYFKSFAEAHPDLQHQDEHGKRAYFSIHLEQLFNGLKAMRKGFGLYSIKYMWNIQDGRDNYNGGFVVMGHTNPNNYEEVKQTERKAEHIAKQLLAKIRADSQSGNALFGYSMDELSSVRAEPYIYRADPKYVGWLVTFDFHHKFKLQHNDSYGLEEALITYQAKNNSVTIQASATPLSDEYSLSFNEIFISNHQEVTIDLQNDADQDIDTFNMPVAKHLNTPTEVITTVAVDYIGKITIRWIN